MCVDLASWEPFLNYFPALCVPDIISHKKWLRLAELENFPLPPDTLNITHSVCSPSPAPTDHLLQFCFGIQHFQQLQVQPGLGLIPLLSSPALFVSLLESDCTAGSCVATLRLFLQRD